MPFDTIFQAKGSAIPPRFSLLKICCKGNQFMSGLHSCYRCTGLASYLCEVYILRKALSCCCCYGCSRCCRCWRGSKHCLLLWGHHRLVGGYRRWRPPPPPLAELARCRLKADTPIISMLFCAAPGKRFHFQRHYSSCNSEAVGDGDYHLKVSQT